MSISRWTTNSHKKGTYDGTGCCSCSLQTLTGTYHFGLDDHDGARSKLPHSPAFAEILLELGSAVAVVVGSAFACCDG